MVPAVHEFTALAAPVFHVYRFYLQGLKSALVFLCSAVRTPFTCLLDAADSVWVLRLPVTFRGQLQTGKR